MIVAVVKPGAEGEGEGRVVLMRSLYSKSEGEMNHEERALYQYARTRTSTTLAMRNMNTILALTLCC